MSSKWYHPSRFLTKIFVRLFHLPICATCPAHLILNEVIVLKIKRRVQYTKFFIMRFSPASCYSLCIRFSRFPRHLITKYSRFRARRVRHSFTHITKQIWWNIQFFRPTSHGGWQFESCFSETELTSTKFRSYVATWTFCHTILFLWWVLNKRRTQSYVSFKWNMHYIWCM
jgi:hypothetical protein